MTGEQATDARLTGFVRALRIIIGAMMLSLVVLTGVFLSVRPEPKDDARQLAQTLSLGAVGLIGLMLLASPILFRLAARPRLRQLRGTASAVGGEAQYLAAFQNGTIMALATLEGPALLGLVSYFLGGPEWVLAVPAGALLGMLLYWPSEDGVRAWIDEQRQSAPAE